MYVRYQFWRTNSRGKKKKQKGGNEEIELNGKHASVDGNVLHKNKRV